MKFGIGLFIVSVLISFVLLNPGVKKHTIGWLVGSEKTVLSQLNTEMDGNRYKIIKVKSKKGLALEVYKYIGDEISLLDSLQLTDKKDAFYKFGDKKHNLFLKDINGDGRAEIILPSIDKNMKARLNVFLFDPDSEKLQKVTKH